VFLLCNLCNLLNNILSLKGVISQPDIHALLLLAIAYQRVEFIQEFFHLPFSENDFTVAELEILYGFGFVHGESGELLTKYYENGYKEPDLRCEPAKLFYEMTRCKAIHIENSRRAVNRFCRRLQRSENFLPHVSFMLYVPLSIYYAFKNEPVHFHPVTANPIIPGLFRTFVLSGRRGDFPVGHKLRLTYAKNLLV